jgi:hypothetical protein
MKHLIFNVTLLLLLLFNGSLLWAKEPSEGIQGGDCKEGMEHMVAYWQKGSNNPSKNIASQAYMDDFTRSRSISIENTEPNHSYRIQTISGLDPGITYLLSGSIKGESIVSKTSQAGANLFIQNTSNQTPGLNGTFDWTPVHLTFVAPDNGKTAIGCRLGNKNNHARGNAWFNQITLSTYALHCSSHPPPFDGKDSVCKSKVYGSDKYPMGVWIYLWPAQGVREVLYSIDNLPFLQHHAVPWELKLAKRDIFNVSCQVKFTHGGIVQFASFRPVIADAYYLDDDNDGYGNKKKKRYALGPLIGYVLNSEDCDDSLIEVNPNGSEICNGLDDDCDGDIDEGFLETFYLDEDRDGYGNEKKTIEACRESEGYTSNQFDCDDHDASIHPDALEYCNANDDDCDFYIDEGCIYPSKSNANLQVDTE